MFLLACLVLAKAETVQIGSGESHNRGVPLLTNWNYSFTQQIYTVAEIGTTGNITSIAFKIVEDPGQSRNIDIYLVKTNKSTFSSGTDFIPVSESDKVFSGEVNFTATGWTTIEFSKTFSYDGSANLCVTVNDHTGSYVYGTARYWYTTEGESQAIYRYNDSYGAYDPASPGSTASNASEASQLLAYKSQIQLTFDDGGGSGEVVHVGSGEETNLPTPFNSNFYYTYSQQIYAPSEIGKTGTITSIAFNAVKTLDGSTTPQTRNLDIYLVETDKSSFSSETDWITDISEADKVFSGSVTFPIGGWTTINFNKPFQYNGTGNLCVIVNDKTGVCGNNQAIEWLVYRRTFCHCLFWLGTSVSNTVDLASPPTNNSNRTISTNQIQLTFAGGGGGSGSGVVQIGSGEQTSNHLPTYSFYNYSLSEQIYTKEELGGAKDLTSVSFYNTNTAKTRDIDVYLVPTSKTSFESTTDWVNVTEADKVFSGEVAFESGEWTTITFQKTYSYNGSSNLVLVVDDNTGSYESGSSSFLVYDATSQALRVYSDPTNYDPTNATSYSGTTMNVKNQVKFGFTGGGDSETPIHSIYVNGYDSPVAGQNSQDHLNLTIPSDANYQIYDDNDYESGWYDDDEAGWFSGTFVEGTNYSLCIRFKANAGYYFADDCAFYINGGTELVDFDNCSIYKDIHKAVIWSVTTPAIESVEPDFIEIGSGENTNNGLPTTSFYNYSLSQQIYTKEELGSAKELTSVSFFNTSSAKTRNIDIYLVPTSKTSFESETDWVNVTEADKVFSGEVTFESNQWTAIGFQKAFSYNGSSNLVLVVDDNTGSYKGSASFLVFDAPNQAIRAFTDNTNYNPTSASGITGTIVNVKNQVRFNEAGISYAPSSLAVSNIQWNSATITWESTFSTFTLQYKPASSSEWTTISSITAKTYTLTGLDQSTTYNVRVQVEGYDDFATTTFTTLVRFTAPTDLKVLSVTPYGAVIKWTDNCGASAWQIAVDDVENITEASHNPFILTGLMPGTEYRIAVRSVMEEDGEQLCSAWSNAVSFTTSIPNPQPEISSVTPTPTSATITWEGQSDSYKVRYRKISGAEYNFEDGTMQGWTTIDADGDEYDWVLGSATSGIYLTGNIPNGGNKGSQEFVTSGSYSNVANSALTPDNYLVSPKVTLGGSITFYACAQDAKYPYEHFGVAVSTSGNTDPADFVTIKEWTMTATGSPSSRRKVQGSWGYYGVDLSAYAGQQGYVAIRHFDSSDNFLLNVDDINILEPGEEDEGEEWQTIDVNGTTATIEGLDPSTSYEFEVLGIMQNQPDASTGIHSFSTLELNPVPTDVAVKTTPTTADISWTAYGDNYRVQYRALGQLKTYLSEDFESGSISGWTTVNLKSGSKLYVDDGNLIFGFIYTSDPPQYLISPMLNGITEEATLEFHYRNYSSGYPESFKVGYSTATNAISDFTWSTEVTVDADVDWHEYTQSVPAGTKYIAIQCTSDDQYIFLIDNIAVYFRSEAAESEWQERWTTDPNIVLTGLEKTTEYEFKIESYISGVDEPAVTDVMTFVTKDDIIDLALDNNGDNEDAIFQHLGAFANVTINNLTFESGKWQGICLPFDVDVEDSPLAGADVRTFESESYADNKLSLNFLTPLTEMKAGMPYIVKLEGSNLVNPTFENVTISTSSQYISKENCAFMCAGYKFVTSDGDYDSYLRLTGSTGIDLQFILTGDYLQAFEPYFYFFTSANAYDEVILNTGDLITGLKTTDNSQQTTEIYNLAGMRLAKKQKGINIVNGKKVLVK